MWEGREDEEMTPQMKEQLSENLLWPRSTIKLPSEKKTAVHQGQITTTKTHSPPLPSHALPVKL